MRVLILHNSYQQRGGEDAAVENEVGLLRNAGHDVELGTVSNHDIVGLSGRAKAFLRAPHNPTFGSWTRELIDGFSPDVVHIHNFFPLLSPAAHEAAKLAGVAVVQTLHNFRLLCAASTFLRDGRICEKCLHGPDIWGVVHRCYRGSLAGSLAWRRLREQGRRKGTWNNSVDRFIVLTEFAKGKFVEGGLPPDKLVVKPNTAEDPKRTTTDAQRAGSLYVGRLSEEKGIRSLVKAWREVPRHIQLTVAGDGPLLGEMRELAPSNVRFLGKQDKSQVLSLMQGARLLVVPSICYEGFPVVVAEAFAAGLPVAASRLGALADIICNGETGLHFAPGDIHDIADVVTQAFGKSDWLRKLGAGARTAYESSYAPAPNLRLLLAVYDDAIRSARQLGY